MSKLIYGYPEKPPLLLVTLLMNDTTYDVHQCINQLFKNQIFDLLYTVT